MLKSVNSVIYNLAFSPKIKFIDLEGMKSDAEAVEALFKLLTISGSIETLNLRHASVNNILNEEFFKSVGQSQTLKYLNLDLDTEVANNTFILNLAKAISMNAKGK
jgi:hypothetical protein